MSFHTASIELPRYTHQYISLAANEIERIYPEGRFNIGTLEAVGRNASKKIRGREYPYTIDDKEPWRYVLEFRIKYKWNQMANVAIFFPWADEKPQRSVMVLTDSDKIPEKKINFLLEKIVEEMSICIDTRKRAENIIKLHGGPISSSRF